MQFTLLAAFALFTAALAMPSQEVKRQTPSVQNSVPINVAAMTDANGNILEFDAANVYLDSKAKGL